MAFIKRDENGKQIRFRVGLDCQKAIEEGEEVRVEQAHAKEVNINNIVKRHGMDLINKVAALQQWTYDDVSGNDFQESMNALIKASATFDQVPSTIRKQFDNDPAKFMDFVQNPENKEKLVEMGLSKTPEIQQPIEVVVKGPLPSPTPDGVKSGKPTETPAAK